MLNTIKRIFTSTWTKFGILLLVYVGICLGLSVYIYFSKKITGEQCLWCTNILTGLLAILALIEIKERTNSNTGRRSWLLSIFDNKKKLIKFLLVILLTVAECAIAIKKEKISSDELLTEKKQSRINEVKNRSILSDTISTRVKQTEKYFADKYDHKLDSETKKITEHFITALAENGKLYDKKQDKVIDEVSKSGRFDPPAVGLDSIPSKGIPNNYLRLDFWFTNKGTRAKAGEIKVYFLASSFGKYIPFGNKHSNYFSFDSMDRGPGMSHIIDVPYNPFLHQTIIILTKLSYFDAFMKNHFDDEYIIEIDPKNHKNSEIPFATGNYREILFEEFKKNFLDLQK
ncbi:hypothetical protein [Mucilaginibacter celer]|uniref:hypothetical protein n=1 Tax=Mucilaginibacter celer TaxID=2305508 RepID=UPI0013CF0BAC|nr:hypothetical protein [Mucilaginibacter celer]